MAEQAITKVNVLFLAAEAAPLVKVGGLGDVAGSLPVALRRVDHPQLDVRLVLPFHGEIRRKALAAEPIAQFQVSRKGVKIQANAYLTRESGLPVYLIEGPPIPPDGPVYDTANPALDGEKYVFFSLACLELTRHLDWQPEILHANDWHTAAAVYAYAQKWRVKGRKPELKTVLTVHNLPFMGKEAEQALLNYGLPRSRDPRLPLWATAFPLPLGLLAADRIVAVSPGYAAEILTPEFGCGLQDILLTRKDRISGILNGLDRELWNPVWDSALPVNFNLESLSRRGENKTALQAELGLPVKPDVPLLIIISRMDQQKGIDIAVAGLRQTAALDWQAVILGTGDPLLESACRSLEAEFPERVRALIRFDSSLSRRMYAAGDILLMPSRYEPCGLAQMIAMNYGCVPLARATGGLIDTICDDPTYANSTGFLFNEANPAAFSEALQRALFTYQERNLWEQIQKRGMQMDFGWEKPAAEYARLYQNLLGGG
jgi:starch synthase